MITAGLFFDIIGTFGAICFLAAYFLLQTGRLRVEQLAYPLTNLIGAILIGISLLWHWNFAAFMLEAAWALISIYGIWKYLKTRRGDAQP